MSGASQRLHTFFVVKQPGRPDRIVVWDTQDISLGRSAENDLVIDDAEVSRRHAVFQRLNNAYVVRNHSMSNPTYVNDQAVKEAELQTKDRVRVAEAELIFYQVAKNPATLGATIEYASQLKSFGGTASGDTGSPDSTMLGLGMMGDDDDEDFEVRPARDFDYDLHGMEAGLEAGLGKSAEPRNLDLELDDPVLGNESAGKDEAWELEAAPTAPAPSAPAPSATGAFSLHLEVEGLSEAQQRFLQGLLGKVVALPPLRIRLKGDDLG